MSYSILVVDDDDSVRVMLSRLLASEGFATSRARDAAEARTELATGTYDLAIIDVVMPGESGVALAQFARQSWPAMPVILISGFASPDAADLASVDEGVRFVPKPFGAEEFLAVVRNSIESPAVRD